MQRVKTVCGYTPNENDSPCQVTIESGKTMEMNCSPKQFIKAYREYYQGALVQNAFPFLNADEREFLITGSTPEQWNKIFGKDPE